jgi:hypothetical protein
MELTGAKQNLANTLNGLDIGLKALNFLNILDQLTEPPVTPVPHSVTVSNHLLAFIYAKFTSHRRD